MQAAFYAGDLISSNDEMISVLNVTVRRYSHKINKAMYDAMQQAMWSILPLKSASMTHNEILVAILPYLPEDLFPGGAKAGWWAQGVQPDQQAWGNLIR
jgi:hypothetical protein